MAFKQFLIGQRRPEVSVVCADQFSRQALGILIQPTVCVVPRFLLISPGKPSVR